MPSSTVPPKPGNEEPKRDMVRELELTREDLKAMRYNLARSCDDLEAARVAATTRTRRKIFPTLATLALLCAFGACAPTSHELELELPADDVAQADELDELEPVPAAELDVPAELDAPAELEPVLVFELDYRHCRGAWADRDDSSTRYTPHPETGLCTFACSWQDARCDAQWFGDPRCFPAHETRLQALCAELGGSCTKALTSDVTYCEAR